MAGVFQNIDPHHPPHSLGGEGGGGLIFGRREAQLCTLRLKLTADSTEHDEISGVSPLSLAERG
jgi:hypothetical protein